MATVNDSTPAGDADARVVNTNGFTNGGTNGFNGGGFTTAPNGGFSNGGFTTGPNGSFNDGGFTMTPGGGFVEPGVIRSRKPVGFTEGFPGRNGHRHTSRSVRRTTSYRSSYRYDQVVELEEKAEVQLFSLMEYIASGARQASILKECWAQLVASRSAFEIEREEWCQQIDELTEQIGCLEGDGERWTIEIGEKDRRIEKLLIELQIAVASLAAEKRKVTERDSDCTRLRRELHDLSEKYSHRESEYHRMQTELEKSYQRIKIVESERDSAREDAEKYQKDYHRVSRERTEISTRLTEITEKYEYVKREVAGYKERIKELDRVCEEQASELVRLREVRNTLIIERDEFRESYEEYKKKFDDCRRKLTTTEETLLQTENILASVRIEVDTLKERVTHIERERDDAVHDRDHCKTEIVELEAKIALLSAEILKLTEDRNKIRIEIEKLKHYYEHEYVHDHEHHDHGHYKHLELSAQIEQLKKVLYLTRSEKETAVKQRIQADQERDISTLRYEQICRERISTDPQPDKPGFTTPGVPVGEKPYRGGIIGRPYDPRRPNTDFRTMSAEENEAADTSLVGTVINHSEEDEALVAAEAEREAVPA